MLSFYDLKEHMCDENYFYIIANQAPKLSNSIDDITREST